MTDKEVYRCSKCNLFQKEHPKCLKCKTDFDDLIKVNDTEILAVIANKLTSIDKKLRED